MSSEDIKTSGRNLRGIEDPVLKRLLESIISNIDVIKTSLDDLENPDSHDWLDVQLENGWVQYGANDNLPQYSKDKYGIVRLRGLIKSGTTTGGTVLFTLPEQHRPERKYTFDTVSNSAQAHFIVHPTGKVTIEVGSATWFSVDNAQFQAYR